MEGLNQSLKALGDNVAENLANSSRFRKIVKRAGIDANKAECDDILHGAIEDFKTGLTKKFEELCKQTKVEEKLDELKVLIEESEEQNKELGVTTGYRPICPADDIKGHLKTVQDGYMETIVETNAKLDDQLASRKEDLRKKLSKLKDLQEEAMLLIRED